MLNITFNAAKTADCNREMIEKLLNAKTDEEVRELCDGYGYDEVIEGIYATADETGKALPSFEKIIDKLYEEFYFRYLDEIIDSFIAD